MSIALEKIRQGIRFLFASLLWSHAFFFLSLPADSATKLGHWLHFTGSEVVIFGLLFALSFFTSGFWRTVGNLAYIYCFPFVLLFYVFYFVGKLLVKIARWFNPRSASQSVQLKSQGVVALVAAQSTQAQEKGPSRAKQFALVVSRPVRKFTFLWCLLLLITTHSTLLWLSLFVVLLHLGRTILRVLQFTLHSDPLFEQAGQAIRQGTENVLSKLAMVSEESPPSEELKNLWNQIKLFEKGVRFLDNETVLVKWTWLLCTSFIVILYLYLAVLFSFAYYGIARIGGASYSWPECLVTSLFIPFLITDFPKIIGLKLLGGIHCTLIVLVSAGTLFNYFRNRLAPIRSSVTVIGVRLADQSVQQKYSILEGKFGTARQPGAPVEGDNSSEAAS